jgi:hypothetical protein
MGSDAARDGMSWDRPYNKLALWAFFAHYRADVPPEVVLSGGTRALGHC